MQKSREKVCSYIWMYRVKDTIRWELAYFSHKSKGLFDQGIPGQVYEFKAQYQNAKGKSNFTDVVEIICL